jgi:hypothetical protein
LDFFVYGRYLEPFASFLLLVGLCKAVDNYSLKGWSLFFSLLVPFGIVADYMVREFCFLRGFAPNLSAAFPLFASFDMSFFTRNLLVISWICFVVRFVNRKLAILLLVCVWAYTGVIRSTADIALQDITRGTLYAESIAGFVKSRAPQGALVAYEDLPYFVGKRKILPEQDKLLKQWCCIRFLRFYLYRYDFRRITGQQWLSAKEPKFYITAEPRVPDVSEDKYKVLAYDRLTKTYICGSSGVAMPVKREIAAFPRLCFNSPRYGWKD